MIIRATKKQSWNVLSKWKEEGRGSLGDEDFGKVACPVSPTEQPLKDIGDLPFVLHFTP